MSEPPTCPQCQHPLTQVGEFWVCPKHGQVSPEKASAPLRIFLSYGHDANEELVRRIKADLEKRRHDVWFDKSEIKFGDEWRRSITDGILQSHRVLSFLSKHSTRNPGVCRDEIAIAIGVKGGNIQTILVESEQEVQPPVNIGHIQWLDMHDWKEQRAAGDAAWKQWYQAKLAEIVRVVESDESRRFAGEIETLNRHLKPIKSEARICQLLSKGFYGRQWLFEVVEKWRTTSRDGPSGTERPCGSQSRLFWIMGAPGVGKSAFAAQLTHTRGDTVIAAQFCEWDKPDHRNAPRVVRSLAFQLATRLPDYRRLLLTLPEIAELDRKDAAELFDYLLANPLRSVIHGGRERYLIVIDALDEAGSASAQGEAGRNPLVEMLARNAQRLPDWLGLVVTSRPEFDVKTPLQALNPFPLDTQSESNRADIRDYLRRELATPLKNRPDADRLVETILEKSEGVFLYVERFCDDVQHGHLSLDRPEQFPQGLGGIFYQYFQRQFPDLEKFRKDVRPALRAILAAREPLPVEILQRLFNWRDEELCDFTRPLASLFPVTKEASGEVIKPYHKALADWLADEAKAGTYFVSVMEGHRVLADSGLAGVQSNFAIIATYFLKHLPIHLVATARSDALHKLLFSFEWLKTKTETGLVQELLEDFDLALAGHLPDEKTRKALQHGLEAVRLSSRVLSEDPTQLPSQLLGRLEGSDNEEIRHLLDACFAWRGSPWLRPLFPGILPVLRQPGGALVASLGGHAHGVHSVAILDDASFAASGAQDGSVCIWDLKHLKCLHALSGHADEVNAVLISKINDGLVAVSGAGKRLPFKLMLQIRSFVERTDTRPSRDNTIRIWNFADGSLRSVLEGHTAAVRCLTSCGRLLLSGSDDGTIRMWDLQEGKSLGMLGTQGAPVVQLAIIPRRLAVVAFSEYDFQLWNILDRSGLGKDKFDYYWQNVVAVDPARMLVALQDTTLSGDEFRLKIWDILNSQDGRESLSMVASFRTSFNAARFVENANQILVGGTDQSLRLIDIASSEVLGQFEGHKDEVTCIAVAETARKCVSGATDGGVLLWDLQRPARAEREVGHSDDVNSVAVSGDGLFASSASHDRSVVVWDTRNGNPIRTFHGHGLSVKCVTINKDGTRVLSGSNDSTVRCWNLEDGQQLFELRGHKGGVGCVAFSNNETRAISGAFDKTLKVWDLTNGCEIVTLEGHQHGIRALSLFHHSDLAVTGDESGLLIVWDLNKGKELIRFNRFRDLAKLESTTKDLWEVARGPEWQPSPEEKHAPCIESLAISPDDRWLIVAQRYRPIVVWDMEKETAILELQGHKGIVFGVAVTSDGRRAISASDDNSLRVWSLETGACVAAFTADSPLYCCAVGPESHIILAGEGARSGKVQFLTLVEETRRYGR